MYQARSVSDAIQISLQEQDGYMLEQFKQELKATNKVLTYSRNTERNKMCQFCVHSEEMANDLRRYNVVERKTFIAELTDLVPKHLYHHYIRGIFDGDGTVYINGHNHLRFGFYGTYKLVSQVEQYLISQINISNNKIIDKGTVSFVTFGKKEDTLNFYDLMYHDATLYLNRKKEKFEHYIQTKYKC